MTPNAEPIAVARSTTACVVMATMALLIFWSCGYESDLSDLSCDTDDQCGTGFHCEQGYCVMEGSANDATVCEGYREACGGRCIDPDNDDDHCGGCNNACPGEQQCSSGSCGCPNAGDLSCGAICVDPNEDANHCGSCNNSCGEEEICDAGICTPLCEEEQLACGGDCVDPLTSLEHCNECDTPCTTAIANASAICAEGDCSHECIDGYDECVDGECLSLQDSDDHCGTCGHSCAPNEMCVGGGCEEILCDPDARPFGSGDGSEGHPYTICAPEHLLNIDPIADDSEDDSEDDSANAQALDAYFELHQDVDLDGATINVIGRGHWDDNDLMEAFSGHFNGMGRTLSNFVIESGSANRIGLFGALDEDGAIVDLHLTDATVTGADSTGGLVGHNAGTIDDSSVSGSIAGVVRVGGLVGFNLGIVRHSTAAVDVQGVERVGGLVGYSSTGGSVSDSAVQESTVDGEERVGGLVGYSFGAIDDSVVQQSALTGTDHVGGLVGRNDAGIQNSKVIDVQVEGTSDRVGGLVGYSVSSGVITDCETDEDVDVTGADSVGGLVGRNNGTIQSCRSGASVDGNNRVGGLVGHGDSGAVESSHAIGAVKGNQFVGGLVGENESLISTSSAAGPVEGSTEVIGGLVGENRGEIVESMATGNVSAETSHRVAGLAGRTHWGSEITDSYATGDVNGDENVGGLVGFVAGGSANDNATITTSFSTGAPSGDEMVGGLTGGGPGDVIDSYWNTDTSQTSSSNAGEPLSASEFSEPDSFVGFDFDSVWELPDGDERPLLQWETQ